MNCVRLVRSLAAAISSFVAFQALAGPITIDVNGADITASLGCSSPGGSLTVCRGTHFEGSGYALDNWEFLLDSDPTITVSFNLTNVSPTAQTYTLTVTLGNIPVAGPLLISGFTGAGTLTDQNGDGATLTDAGSPLYDALIDGASVHTLLDTPQLFTVAPSQTGQPGTTSIPLTSFGPDPFAQSVVSTIGTVSKFTVSAADSVFLPFGFDVQPGAVSVPEPATLALFALALAGLELSRRWRAKRPERFTTTF